MEGLTTLVLPTLSHFGIPEGLKSASESGSGRSVFGRRRSLTLPTERFSKPPTDLRYAFTSTSLCICYSYYVTHFRSTKLLFHPVSFLKCRATIYALMYNKWMDRFILTCIIISTVSMAFNGQEAQNNVDTSHTLFVLEWVVTVVFIIEAFFRIISLEGFVYYWKDPWNKLDFTIVILGLVTELPFMTGGVSFSAFRAFRALRALRTMKYAQGLRQIVDTFIETFRGIVNVLFVYSYFVFLFATLGIDLFQSTIFSQCVVPKHPNTSLLDAPYSTGNYTIAKPAIYCKFLFENIFFKRIYESK